MATGIISMASPQQGYAQRWDGSVLPTDVTSPTTCQLLQEKPAEEGAGALLWASETMCNGPLEGAPKINHL
jgi:hypothetical protein